MALKLNAHVARLLHGKQLDLSDPNSYYDEDANPLLGFKNHFNLSHSFTQDEMGMLLWRQLLPIANSDEMPQSPFNFW